MISSTDHSQSDLLPCRQQPLSTTDLQANAAPIVMASHNLTVPVTEQTTLIRTSNPPHLTQHIHEERGTIHS